MFAVSEKGWGMIRDTVRDTLYWDKCDGCYKMVVRMNEDIHTALRTVDGKRFQLMGVYKIRIGFVGEYRAVEE